MGSSSLLLTDIYYNAGASDVDISVYLFGIADYDMSVNKLIAKYGLPIALNTDFIMGNRITYNISITSDDPLCNEIRPCKTRIEMEAKFDMCNQNHVEKLRDLVRFYTVKYTSLTYKNDYLYFRVLPIDPRKIYKSCNGGLQPDHI